MNEALEFAVTLHTTEALGEDEARAVTLSVKFKPSETLQQLTDRLLCGTYSKFDHIEIRLVAL